MERSQSVHMLKEKIKMVVKKKRCCGQVYLENAILNYTIPVFISFNIIQYNIIYNIIWYII